MTGHSGPCNAAQGGETLCVACRAREPITADAITDEQIRELRDTAWDHVNSTAERNAIAEVCNLATARMRSPEGRAEIAAARARCAEILNTRAR